MEANQVLRSVLTALTASNSHVTEEIVMVPQEEEVTHEGEALKADGVKDPAALIPVTKSQPPIKEKDDKKSEDPMSNKDICHFYTLNNQLNSKSCAHDQGEWVKIPLLPNKVRKRSGTRVTTGDAATQL